MPQRGQDNMASVAFRGFQRGYQRIPFGLISRFVGHHFCPQTGVKETKNEAPYRQPEQPPV